MTSDNLIENKEILLECLDGYFDWIIEKDQIYLSDNICAKLGLEEYIDKYFNFEHIFRKLHFNDHNQFLKILERRGTKTEDYESSEFRIRLASGDYLWLSIKGKLFFRDDGRPKNFTGIFHNVHVYCTFQSELKTVIENTEKISQAKSNFIAHLNHELRTPIAGIIGIASVIKETKLDEKQRHYIDTINDSAEIILNLVNDILDISKIAAGKLEIEKKPFLIKKTIEKSINLIRPIIEGKGITFNTNIDNFDNKFYLGDLKRIQQILLNLLSNATKFTHQGQINLTISLKKSSDLLDEIYFEIQDSGIGISQDHLPNLFQDFTQANVGITNRYGGTGLGLAICKKLVNMMKGSIDVVSAPYKGSTFWFTIPLEKAEGIDQKIVDSLTTELKPFDKPSPMHNDSPLKILVAEDNLVNQEVITGIIEVIGDHVTIAKNGQEAVNFCQDHQFDLILMDINMPIMDGLTATRHIKEIPQYKDIPIIAVTADTISWTKEKCFAAGMNEVIAKPVTKNKLSELFMPLRKNRPQPMKENIVLADDINEDSSSKLSDDKISQSLSLLAEDIGMPRVLKLLKMYKEDSISLVNEIKLYENQEVHKAAHTLAGMSENLGFRDFGSTCRILMRENNPDIIKTTVEHLNIQKNHLDKFIENYLSEKENQST